MGELEIGSQTITSHTAVTTLKGEMDSGNFGLLEDEFNKLLESGVIGVVLDLSGAEGLSSAGIGAILNMSRLLGSRKGKLVLAGAKPKLAGTLEMLGLQDALQVADTAEQAKKMIASIKGP